MDGFTGDKFGEVLTLSIDSSVDSSKADPRLLKEKTQQLAKPLVKTLEMMSHICYPWTISTDITFSYLALEERQTRALEVMMMMMMIMLLLLLLLT